jgi:hypothetical protein
MLCIVNRMSEHDQPSSTPAAELAAEDDEALMKMQRDFPGHRIWREIIPGRTVYVARSQDPAARPHTVVTPDLRELHATLTQASQAGRPR